jgi:hypothetical protein
LIFSRAASVLFLRLFFLLSLPLFFLQAHPVAAQLSLEGEPIPPSDPEPPRLRVTPSLEVTYEYDDNILLRAVRRESDYITRVRPGVGLLVEQERVRWATDLKAEFAFYRDHPDLSTWNRSQNIDTHLTLRPSGVWTFEFRDTFTHSIDPTEQLDLLFRRTEYYSNALSLKAGYRFSPRLTMEGEAINRITQFKDPALVDVTEDELRGALAYRLTPVATLTPEYRYRNFYFENRGHTEAHTASIREEYRFTETLTGRAMAGALAIVDRGTAESYLLLGLGAEQRYSPTVVFRGDYLRDVSVVGGLSGTFISDNLSGSVTFHVTQWFDSIFAATWTFQQPVLSNRSDIDTLWLRIEEQFRITSWLKGIAGYSYRRQNFHDEAIRDIYDNRFFIGLTAFTTYPPPP